MHTKMNIYWAVDLLNSIEPIPELELKRLGLEKLLLSAKSKFEPDIEFTDEDIKMIGGLKYNPKPDYDESTGLTRSMQVIREEIKEKYKEKTDEGWMEDE